MSRLGGTTVDLNPSTSQIGRGEPIKDTARVLVDIVMPSQLELLTNLIWKSMQVVIEAQ